MLQNLGSQPVVVEIDRVYAIAEQQSSFTVCTLFLTPLVTTHTIFKYNDEEAKKNRQLEKQRKLNQYELTKQAEGRSGWDAQGFACELLLIFVMTRKTSERGIYWWFSV